MKANEDGTLQQQYVILRRRPEEAAVTIAEPLPAEGDKGPLERFKDLVVQRTLEIWPPLQVNEVDDYFSCQCVDFGYRYDLGMFVPLYSTVDGSGSAEIRGAVKKAIEMNAESIDIDRDFRYQEYLRLKAEFEPESEARASTSTQLELPFTE